MPTPLSYLLVSLELRWCLVLVLGVLVPATVAGAAGEPSLTWKAMPPAPDPEGFASPFAGVAGGRLLIGGGANFPGKKPWEGGKKVWYDAVYALDPGTHAWTQVGTLLRPMAYGQSVTTPQGTVWAGGADPVQHHREVDLLTWNENGLARERLAELPEATAFGSCALAGRYFYLAGGIAKPDSTTAQSLFWRLDVSRKGAAWEVLPTWPGVPRMLAGMGAVGDRIFLVAGVSLHASPDGKPARTYLRDAYAYDPKTGWSKIDDLPAPATAAPSPLPVSASGKLFVVGGDDGVSVSLAGPHHPGFTSAVWVLDSRTGHWSKGPAAQVSRATSPTVPWGEGCLIINGERMPGVRSPEIWSLEVAP